MNAIDTNILVYSHDARDPQKRDVAARLIDRLDPFALPWQVGCEFVAVARKLSGFTTEAAWDALEQLRASCDVVLLPSEQTWDRARTMQKAFVLSIWDALLVAACLEGGVTTLYSEDMGSPRTIESLRIVNPFA